MNIFNVIVFDFNKKEFESYDIMPYLRNCYHKTPKKPETFDEFKEFVDDVVEYEFWARCEYEVILLDWPCQKVNRKIDVYEQVLMNLDLVVKLLMEDVLK